MRRGLRPLKVRRGREGTCSFMDLQSPARVHIMGVCGAAMSALAGLLVQNGYRVSGSDRAFYPPASEELKSLGVKLFKGYKREHILPQWDVVVVGNVISRGMEEADALLHSRLPYVSLPDFLSFLMQDKTSVMVCGTHGKTTLSFLCAWILDQCGKDPGFLIGGVSKDFQAGFRWSKSPYFVVEGDEYDTAFFEKTPKFMHYPASHILINNVEFDHADIYKNLREVQQAFRRLVTERAKAPGALKSFVVGLSSPFMEELVACAEKNSPSCQVVTYGKNRGDWQLLKQTPLPDSGQMGQKLVVKEPGGDTVSVETSLVGEHNAWNVLGAYALSRTLGLDPQSVLKALSDFKGVKRRFEFLGTWRGVDVVEDFAHHPSAVREVLQAARQHAPGRRLLVAFEPRSATSRRKVFQTSYQQALALADIVFCLKAYDQSKLDEPDKLNSEDLVKGICRIFQSKNTASSPGGGERGKAFYAPTVEDMASQIQATSRPQDILILMSNGDFQPRLFALLKNPPPTKTP